MDSTGHGCRQVPTQLIAVGVSAVLLIGLVMFVSFASIPAAAQDPPPPMQFGQGGSPGGFGGPGQGPGGFGRAPFVMGTVLEVGVSQKMIAVSSPFGGNEQDIRVTDSTKIFSQTEVKISALKVGDTVQIQGVPTGITASSLTIGEAPNLFGSMGQSRSGASGNRQSNQFRMNRSFASASGKVKALSPLTIVIDNNVTVTVRTAPDARINKITTVALNTLKAGDNIMAAGETDAQGVLTATTITVNMNRGMGMMGGPGGGAGSRGPGRQR